MSLYISGAIIALIIGLSGYAFFFQSMEKKRKQQKRITAALKQRANSFRFMIQGFPTGFLTKDLSVLVHKCLMETCQRLSQLDPKDKSHLEDFQVYSTQLEEAKRKPPHNKRIRLDNPSQIKDVKKTLEELNKFIAQLKTRGSLNDKQFSVYSAQIKKLVVQISVDGYQIQAKHAQAAGKPRLSAHYFTLARKLLLKDGSGNDDKALADQLTATISELEKEAAALEPQAAPPTPTETEQEASQQWQDLESEANWKKKNVYD